MAKPRRRHRRPHSTIPPRWLARTAGARHAARAWAGRATTMLHARTDLNAASAGSSQPPLSGCCDDRLNPPARRHGRHGRAGTRRIQPRERPRRPRGLRRGRPLHGPELRPRLPLLPECRGCDRRPRLDGRDVRCRRCGRARRQRVPARASADGPYRISGGRGGGALPGRAVRAMFIDMARSVVIAVDAGQNRSLLARRSGPPPPRRSSSLTALLCCSSLEKA